MKYILQSLVLAGDFVCTNSTLQILKQTATIKDVAQTLDTAEVYILP